MLSYHLFQLENGLRVLVHEVPSSKTAVVNVMYQVGSAYEEPDKTGLAHLFEHLMFSGSKHAPKYDKALQSVGGENNAYTTLDVTNYYCTLPARNIETAFWLESDRMAYLTYSKEQLEVQRKVVIEEFRQGYHNRPYGDAWHYLLQLAYQDHPYSWPTIGKNIEQIEGFTRADIDAFGKRFYTPSQAVLVVAGGVEVAEVERLSRKWFGELTSEGVKQPFIMPKKAKCRKGTHKQVKGAVPFNVLYQAYHIPGRKEMDYLSILLLVHVLGTGKSSFLYKELVEKRELLTDIMVYTLEAHVDDLLIIEGVLREGVAFEAVSKAITEVITQVCKMEIGEELWEKAKNQFESAFAFEHVSLMNRANELALATLLGDPNFFNEEVMHRLHTLTAEQMQAVGKNFLKKGEEVRLYYGKD